MKHIEKTKAPTFFVLLNNEVMNDIRFSNKKLDKRFLFYKKKKF